MEEVKCKQVGSIIGGGYNEMTARIYDIEGACPTVRACGCGKIVEPKIIEPSVVIGSMQKNAYVGNGDKCPTLTQAMGAGGGQIPMVGYAEPRLVDGESYLYAVDEQNHCVRKDGTVGTLTTDGSSPKHNNRVMESQLEQIPQNHIEVGKQIRVRKLTERECFRLMGVKDEDFEKIAYGKSYPTGYYEKLHNRTMKKCEWKILYLLERKRRQSKSSLYHLAGDSIVVNVLMEIFQKML